MHSQEMNKPRCTAPRVLIIVHGYEPPGWGAEVSRLLSMWMEPVVRMLAVINVPTPPFTSLTKFARKTYCEALQSWMEEEETRVHGVIDQIVLHCAETIDVVQIKPPRGRLGPSIIEHANTWSADVVVISAPARQSRSWLWPGRFHRRLLHDSPCSVMITKRGA